MDVVFANDTAAILTCRVNFIALSASWSTSACQIRFSGSINVLVE